jgi:hypothetical protein
MAVRSYRELIAWRKAMDLVNAVYATTRSWPNEELYALTSQIRRAAVSVPSNIAEGQGRSSTKELLKHLSIAAVVIGTYSSRPASAPKRSMPAAFLARSSSRRTS